MLAQEKIVSLPTEPGVYQFKNAAGQVIYVGKAKSLRQRVRSYFLDARAAEAKTDTLVREAVEVSTIVVDNEREALALGLAHFIHRTFRVPSCTVDLTRSHSRPCLQYYIQRCQGPCVAGLTTEVRYATAVNDVRTFLEGRHGELQRQLERRMVQA